MTNNADRPVPQPGILDISPYIPGKAKALGDGPVYKLSANENPLGPSPKAIDAYNKLNSELEFYPDGAATDLREAIAAQYGLNPAHIVCGAGSDEILGFLTERKCPNRQATIKNSRPRRIQLDATAYSGLPVIFFRR